MIKLMLIFMYVGIFTIGGGMVAIPLIQQEVVERGLISLEDFFNMVAIAESTPGPIGINIATFVGFQQFGFIGALLVSISFILPSFIIVSILAEVLNKYRESRVVTLSLMYVKAAIVGLIGYTLLKLLIHVFDITNINTLSIDINIIIILVLVSIAYYTFRKKPWIVILFGALFGIFIL